MDTSKFNKSQISNRQIDELIGLCRGIIADGIVCQKEAEYLEKWLVANKVAADNPVINNLTERVSEMLSDNVLDSEEAVELYQTLDSFTGGEIELGEVIKATTLPFNEPAPDIVFENRVFCFTGTFSFGKRSECEAAVKQRGGLTSSKVTMNIDYLVIGVYATSDWKHSSYGGKILKAVEYRDNNDMPVPIVIAGEEHWQKYL